MKILGEGGFEPMTIGSMRKNRATELSVIFVAVFRKHHQESTSMQQRKGRMIRNFLRRPRVRIPPFLNPFLIKSCHFARCLQNLILLANQHQHHLGMGDCRYVALKTVPRELQNAYQFSAIIGHPTYKR